MRAALAQMDLRASATALRCPKSAGSAATVQTTGHRAWSALKGTDALRRLALRSSARLARTHQSPHNRHATSAQVATRARLLLRQSARRAPLRQKGLAARAPLAWTALSALTVLLSARSAQQAKAASTRQTRQPAATKAPCRLLARVLARLARAAPPTRGRTTLACLALQAAPASTLSNKGSWFPLKRALLGRPLPSQPARRIAGSRLMPATFSGDKGRCF